MFQRWVGMQSASRYARFTLAVVGFALLLILLFGGSKNGDSPEIRNLEQTDKYEDWAVGRSGGYTDLNEPVPLSAQRREMILQNLSALRAKYKLVGPRVMATSATDNEPGRFLAQTVGDLLAHYNLGQFKTNPSTTAPAPQEGGPVTLLARNKDSVIARALVEAIAPALVGTVRIVYTEELSTGSLLLVVNDEPAFTAQGVAVFSR